MSTFQQLWAVAEQEAQRSESKAEYAFGDIGLFLEKSLENHDYEVTPLNSQTFASTGGDGVHFGFLTSGNEPPEGVPIVMTVPCAWEERANLIVGENLYDFLCLGCQFGYFSLEQLIYDLEETLLALQNPQPSSEPEERLLNLLTSKLSLCPWKNVSGRLEKLNRIYLPLLKMKP